ncbi:MAG TPA: hypothetical protein VFH68_15880 [Polyangia bacterium]|nr:hypothetical protein [Polyangia bacterium]
MGVVAILLSSPVTLAAGAGEQTGELGGAQGEKAKPQYTLQAADPDNPTDPEVVAAKKKAALEAELAKKKKPVEEGPPFYQKWQFWAIAGGVLVGLAGAIYATTKIVHSVNGGDVAPCPMGYKGCFGEGR